MSTNTPRPTQARQRVTWFISPAVLERLPAVAAQCRMSVSLLADEILLYSLGELPGVEPVWLKLLKAAPTPQPVAPAPAHADVRVFDTSDPDFDAKVDALAAEMGLRG